MRRILVLVFVLLSIQGFAQPSNYSWYKQRTRQYSFMADSAMYLPRYNGTPSGVRSNESSTISGMVGIDTTNHRQYFRSGSSWRRLANYTELGVDSIWRVAGKDSIFWSKQGTTYKIKDSTGGSSSVPLSSLTAATGINTIDNGVHSQSWLWDQPTGGYGLYLESTSITSGKLLGIIINSDAAASNGQTGLYIITSGANINSSQTTYGQLILNNHTGTGGTNVGISSSAAGGSTNIAALFGRGSVNIGTNGTESGVLKLLGGTSGTVTIQPAAAAGTYTLTLPTTDGASGEFLQTDGSGALTWAAASGGSPAGNFGNLQINRNGAFATPGSDSLTYNNAGLSVNNDVNVTGAGKAFIGRWKARVDSTTSSATPTINTDNIDIYKLTAQAADITSFTTNLSGTPYDGDILEIVITGTATRAITWGASFVSTTVTLPTTTSGTTTLTVILQYFKSSSYGNNKWHCVNYF